MQRPRELRERLMFLASIISIITKCIRMMMMMIIIIIVICIRMVSTVEYVGKG